MSFFKGTVKMFVGRIFLLLSSTKDLISLAAENQFSGRVRNAVLNRNKASLNCKLGTLLIIKREDYCYDP